MLFGVDVIIGINISMYRNCLWRDVLQKSNIFAIVYAIKIER
jgi:hypothetical protein